MAGLWNCLRYKEGECSPDDPHPGCHRVMAGSPIQRWLDEDQEAQGLTAVDRDVVAEVPPAEAGGPERGLDDLPSSRPEVYVGQPFEFLGHRVIPPAPSYPGSWVDGLGAHEVLDEVALRDAPHLGAHEGPNSHRVCRSCGGRGRVEA